MIKIEILSARDPQWASEDYSAIDCWVRTNTLIEEVPFTASKYDCEPHGRELYERCLAGELGEIAPMQPRPQLPPSQLKIPSEYQLLGQFLHEANQENSRKSFRSVVIVWSSFLENILEGLLEKEASRTGDTGKPPPIFDKKIKQALTLNLITQEEAKRCRLIRLIRNKAAHEWKLSLSTKGIRKNLHTLYKLDHRQTFVFHEDLDFLIQMIYSASCSMLVMKFLTRLSGD